MYCAVCQGMFAAIAHLHVVYAVLLCLSYVQHPVNVTAAGVILY